MYAVLTETRLQMILVNSNVGNLFCYFTLATAPLHFVFRVIHTDGSFIFFFSGESFTIIVVLPFTSSDSDKTHNVFPPFRNDINFSLEKIF